MEGGVCIASLGEKRYKKVWWKFLNYMSDGSILGSMFEPLGVVGVEEVFSAMLVLSSCDFSRRGTISTLCVGYHWFLSGGCWCS